MNIYPKRLLAKKKENSKKISYIRLTNIIVSIFIVVLIWWFHAWVKISPNIYNVYNSNIALDALKLLQSLVFYFLFGGFWLIIPASPLIFYYVYSLVKRLRKIQPEAPLKEIPKRKSTIFAQFFLALLTIPIIWQFIAYPLNNYNCSKNIQSKEYTSKEYTLKSNPNLKFEVKNPEKIKRYARYDTYGVWNLENPVRHPWESVDCITSDDINLKLKNTNISVAYKINEPIDISTFDNEIDSAINNGIFSFALPDNNLILKDSEATLQPLFFVNSKLPVFSSKYYIFSDNQLGLGKLDFKLKENQQKVADLVLSDPKMGINYGEVHLNFSSLAGDKRVAFRFGYEMFTFFLEKVEDNFIIQKIERTPLSPNGLPLW